MGRRTIKNYPSPRLMQTIGATNQTVAEAIGELAANCFDARCGNDRLEIVIDMRGSEIAVIDDGRGMTDDVLERAVCIAEDMSKHVERGQGAKGHFGMGFKTSCATLGKFYEIYTRPVGADVEYHVAFDISEYAKRPSGADAWDVVIEDGAINRRGPLGDRAHGTAFVVSRLNRKDSHVSAVISYIGTAFKGHLDNGDKIWILDEENRYEATAEKRKYVAGTKAPIDLRCGPDGEYHITGWVALDQQVRNDGLYGFNIYRNGQLIEPWNREWFSNHLMTSRIFGEVNMDFLEATFYKQGPQQSESWHMASAAMREFLKPVVTASRALSRKGNIHNPGERKKIVDTLREKLDVNDDATFDDEIDTTDELEEDKGDGRDPKHKEGQKRSVGDKFKGFIKEDRLRLEDGTEIPITLVETTSSARMEAPFDYTYDDVFDEEPDLQVVVYTDHPLFTKRENQETIRILATADAIYRVLVERRGVAAGEAFTIKNKWILERLGATGRS